MGSILRAYREWLLSGDRAWLETIWPGVKRAIAFAATHWDFDGDGVLDGKQHTTYDIEFHGPNPLGGIYYLAALRAVAALAKVMGEPDLMRTVDETFSAGSSRLDELLWNGEYYIQQLEDVNTHKYQHGTGCLSDQLLGQLHARLLGLGDLVPAEHARTAIRAVFAHNFRRDFRDHVNGQRTYVLNDESGLVLCSWPHDGRPRFPFVYSDEVWTGIEYQVAAHLIYEGWVDQGIEVVEAVRARHDGLRRNPWNEVECGHHYARSMSSWSLLLALSGFQVDVAAGQLAFGPRMAERTFRCFFSAGTGWGRFEQRVAVDGLAALVTIDSGGLRLRRIGLRPLQPARSATVMVGGRSLPLSFAQATDGSASVVLDEPVELRRGETLIINLKSADGVASAPSADVYAGVP
ncbi:MAG: glycoside hydrolase family 116 protein [Chloroflexi bacterium]|nr:glycoside hydrolase family 116 protein [Chloroflexota bacterium]